MDYTALITTLLTLFAEHGPDLVKQVTDLIHGNPQQQGETDAAYVARTNQLIDAKLADAGVKLDTVLNDTGDAPAEV